MTSEELIQKAKRDKRMTEVYKNMVFFNGYQYLLTDKNILIKKNIQTGEETTCKITKHKFFSAKEIEEHMKSLADYQIVLDTYKKNKKKKK